jgi:hypothetical protein
MQRSQRAFRRITILSLFKFYSKKNTKTEYHLFHTAFKDG